MNREQKIQVGNLEWFYRQELVASEESPDGIEGKSDRPTVLLLHGLPAHSYTWRQLMPLLAEAGLPSIAPDWIGSGFSSKPNKRDFAYTPEAFLAALTDLIAALELDNFYLIIQGFLGSVGLQYAFNHPEKIAGLIILNTPITKDAKLPWLMKQLSLPFVGDMMTQDPLLVDRTLEKGSGFVISDGDLNVLRKPFLQSSAVGRALMVTLQKLQLDKTTAAIQKDFIQWEKPTLILWGASDPWLETTEVKKIVASLNNVEMVELAEAKHYPQEHWSKEIATEILQFFRRQVF